MNTHPRQRGSLLMVVMGFLLIMTAVIIGWPSRNAPGRIGGWLAAAITDSIQAHRKIAHTAAFYLAEAGAEHAKEYLSTQANIRSAIIRTAGTIPASTVLGAGSVPLGCGSYTASVNVSLGSWAIPLYTITAVGTADPDSSPGSGDEVSRKIIVKATLGSFARYAYFSNNESSNIWFITTDALLGYVHTNTSLNIAGKPDFWGKVTQVGPKFTYYNNGSSISSTSDRNGTKDVPHFRDGYQLSAPTVYYPTDTTEFQTAAAGPYGLTINTSSDITLSVAANNQGIITYTQDEQQQVWHEPETKTLSWTGWNPEHTIYHSYYKRETYTVPGYYSTETVKVTHSADVFDSEVCPTGKAVVYVNGNAAVSGTLAGQLTILTQGDLIVDGDITYRVDPVDYDQDGLLSDPNGNGINDPGYDRDGDGLYTLPGERPDDTDDDGDGVPDRAGYDQPESTDTLGLVAKGDVVVADDNGPPIDRKICATIMALGAPGSTGSTTGSFRVENYTNHLEGTLTIVGGLIQKTRGAVGTFSGSIGGQTTKTAGFSKNYIFDRRVLYFPPPYFPPTNMFDLIYWQEVAP